MLDDIRIRRSLDSYIRSRIREISLELGKDAPRAIRVWKCKNEADFVYGYYVGRIEEGAMRYLLKATRASGGPSDLLDVRDILEEHKDELRRIITCETQK